MSSDLSTSTGFRVPPIYQEDMLVIALFRIPDQFVDLPCPGTGWCEAGCQHLATLLADDGVPENGEYESRSFRAEFGRAADAPWPSLAGDARATRSLH